MCSLSEEQEQRFLEHIAADYLPANKLAVKEIFREIFKHNQELPPNYLKLEDALNKSEGTIKTHLTDIYKSFEDESRDCPLKYVSKGSGKKNKSLILYRWLWSEKYPSWVGSHSITPKSIWQQLLNKANQTNSIKLLTGERQRDLGLGQQTVRLGSQI
jgi:hypothetical protein